MQVTNVVNNDVKKDVDYTCPFDGGCAIVTTYKMLEYALPVGDFKWSVSREVDTPEQKAERHKEALDKQDELFGRHK